MRRFLLNLFFAIVAFSPIWAGLAVLIVSGCQQPSAPPTLEAKVIIDSLNNRECHDWEFQGRESYGWVVNKQLDVAVDIADGEVRDAERKYTRVFSASDRNHLCTTARENYKRISVQPILDAAMKEEPKTKEK